jgi:hypothetical protein
MTSALDEGAWSASRPDRVLSPGKVPPVPIEEKGGKIVVQAITWNFTLISTGQEIPLFR